MIRRLDAVIGWPAIVAWLCVMLALSSIPNAAPPREPAFPADKVAHVIEYGVLAALLSWVLLRRSGDATRWRSAACVVAAVSLALAWGAIDETYQRLIPGRDPSWDDLAADAIGASCGAVIAAVLRRVFVRPQPSA